MTDLLDLARRDLACLDDNAPRRKLPSHNGGEKNGRSKLSASDVRAIRACAALGDSTGQIAKAFGISTVHTRKIIQRTKWAHLED